MPTTNPRITFTVSEELMKEIDEYRFKHRMKNQTQAIVSLINIGLESFMEKPAQPEAMFTEDEVHLINDYRCVNPIAQEIVRTTLSSQAQKQEKNRA